MTANTYLKNVLLINIFAASMMQVISEEISRNDCGRLARRVVLGNHQSMSFKQ